MGNAIGPDVSFYQDEPETPEQIDFEKMAKVADYVIIRAGQNLWPDSDFKYNWAEAKKAKIPRGTYWFYDSRANPKRQAELWAELMNGDLGELPLFADFEEAYGGQYTGWRKWYDFLERLKELVGTKEIAIYTAFYYWRDNAPSATTQKDSLDYFYQYPLWIANYGASEPSVPKPWNPGEWLFWQYTEVGDGELYGVESRGIDLNYFNGDKLAFRKRFNLDSSSQIDPKYKIDLSVRDKPEQTATVTGMLQHDETVHVLEASNNGNWMEIKRSDDSTGWVFNTHLIKVESPAPTDPGDSPGPGEPTDGDVKLYRVATTALNVREGPSASYDKVGHLLQGEIVKALEYAVANSWIKIERESDGLTGWCSARYLTLQDTPSPTDTEDPSVPDEPSDSTEPTEPDTPTDPTEPTEPDTPTDPTDSTEPTVPDEPSGTDEEWYRVTASALNVREGPGKDNEKIGLLQNGEIIKALDKNEDGTWIKINRQSDDLTGWSFARYLSLIDTPMPPGTGQMPPTSDIVNWYQVKVSTLNVRNGPSKTESKIGSLKKNEIVAGLELNGDESWSRVQRFDGLMGWCSTTYLTELGDSVPEQISQKIFSGVTYFRKKIQAPRKMVAHVLAIDTRSTGLKCMVTPPGDNNGLICSRKTTKFLNEFNLQLAINGDGFSYLDQDEYDPDQYCSNGGEPVKVNSYAASRGNIYSERWDDRPILYVNKSNEITFNKPKGNIYNAISGDRMLVVKGKAASNLEDQSVEPRTAAGVNQNGRWLFLVVVDGRQPDHSDGASFPELAEFMISQLGVYTALNLDGGGSSTMVIEGAQGGAFILNAPIEGNIPGNESTVANHLGFSVK